MQFNQTKKVIVEEWTKSINNRTFWGKKEKHIEGSLSASFRSFRSILNPQLYSEPTMYIQLGDYSIEEYEHKDFSTPYHVVNIVLHAQMNSAGATTLLTDAGSGVPKNTTYITSFTAENLIVIYDNKNIPHGHVETTQTIHDKIVNGDIKHLRTIPHVQPVQYTPKAGGFIPSVFSRMQPISETPQLILDPTKSMIDAVDKREEEKLQAMLARALNGNLDYVGFS